MTTTPARIGLRPFGEILLDISGGDVEKRATAKIAEAVRAAEATGKAASLTLTLKISKTPKGIQILGDVTAKVPREPMESTFFYVDDRGSLTKDNPKQVGFADPGFKVAAKESREYPVE